MDDGLIAFLADPELLPPAEASALAAVRWVTDLIPRGPRRPEGPLPLAAHLIALDSPRGVEMLAAADISGDYLRLTPYFAPQRHPKSCGATTIAMVLNALDTEPERDGNVPGRRYHQGNVFNQATESVVQQADVERGGMSLIVLAGMFEAHGARVAVSYASESSLSRFREEAVAALQDPDSHLVVNYRRAVLLQQGTGHISPVAAYHAASDRFLVLDVAWDLYPPAWVAASDLFEAMNTNAGKRSRGWLVAGR